MTVIYGHVIHSLRRATMQPTQSQVEALTTTFQQLEAELSRVQQNFPLQLASELSTLRESFQQQLSSELSPVHESFQQYQEVLAVVPTMKAQFQYIESATLEEVRRVKASMEKLQSHLAEREKHTERPVLRALPAIQQGNNKVRRSRMQDVCQPTTQTTAEERFDTRAFVFTCLEENPDLKLAEIEQLAQAIGKEISQPTASRYRKQFFARGESSTTGNSESPTMKAESQAAGQ